MLDEAATVVFLGPSLPREAARAILPADYRPPVAKGDIYALLTTGVQRIVVIDGVFHSQPSVWQRELLAAIDEGIEVLGASSMGALRAAELHPYGMQGLGTVFEWYRRGVLDGDDEVALWHSTEELAYRALSEPLVNIRATLARAVADGWLTADEANTLVARAKHTHYPDRSLRALAASPQLPTWPAARRDALRGYLETHAVDLKAEDARLALAHCAQHPPRPSRDRAERAEAICSVPRAAGVPRRHADPSSAFDPLAEGSWAERADPCSAAFRHVAVRYRTLACGGRPLAWTELKRAMRARADWDARHARFTIDWCWADLARQQGAACPDAALHAHVARWAEDHAVHDVAAWRRSRGLTRREHAELLATHALVSWLRAAGPAAIGATWDPEVAEPLAQCVPADDPRGALGAADAAVLHGWLTTHGFACPRGERRRVLAAWRLDSDVRRQRLARRLGVSATRLRRALDQRIAAAWLLAAGLGAFGRFVDAELAAVQAFQLAASDDELAAFAQAGAS